MKLWLMKQIIYIWDVFFTFIDNTQLRIYMHMKEFIEDLNNDKSDYNNLGEYEDWDNIQ